ncbi:unnamed protein product [Aureobasidium uvarum]|uniref:Uncharacterized protein n=1 Tax=Aureobasidium uvarum TaxID=2773716 RepID=A0A9N8KN15_9PEZI|nr:unnamed protein product [Aureobasidium uvarum]
MSKFFGSQNTSAHNTTTRNQPDKNEDDDDDDGDGTDYGDEDDEDEEDDYYEPRRPLAFLRIEPFPRLNLSIDGSPIAIVDTSQFVEETEKKDLTAVHAIATILWNWHPNALRAFLDLQKYSAFEFAICDDYPGSKRITTHMITRHDRAILVGYYNQDMDWGHQVSYGILEDGRWKPLWGSSDGLGGNSRPEFIEMMGGMWARDQMYLKRWRPQEYRTIELTLGGGNVDPASLY